MPASSLVSKPTRTLGSCWRGRRRSTASSVPGAIFAAQPAALAPAVSFTVSVKAVGSRDPFCCKEQYIAEEKDGLARACLQHYGHELTRAPDGGVKPPLRESGLARASVVAGERHAGGCGAGNEIALFIRHVAFHEPDFAAFFHDVGAGAQVCFPHWAQVIDLQLDGGE